MFCESGIGSDMPLYIINEVCQIKWLPWQVEGLGQGD